MLDLSREELIDRAIRDGSLRESAYLDVKESVGASPSARREVAKDMASFAIDGGQILVGVGEQKEEGTFFAAPMRLAGEVERLEQIAANRIDPPLDVRVREVRSAQSEGCGYLLVDVPSSPSAPHMVDGVYYARGERTTRRLTDAEVARLHAARRDQRQVAEDALDQALALDPVPPSQSKRGHLFLVAQPLTGGPEMAERLVWEDAGRLRRVVYDAEALMPTALEVAPLPSDGGQVVEHMDGRAFVAHGLQGRTLVEGWSEDYLYELVFRENGSIRVFCGRMTDFLMNAGAQQPAILEVIALAYAARLAAWTAGVSEATGYRGSWAFGLEATGLEDLRSHRAFTEHGFSSQSPLYGAATFRQTTTATGIEVREEPLAVGFRLVRRLLRALRTEHHYRGVIGLM